MHLNVLTDNHAEISIIRLHCMIERVLEECVVHMRLTSPDTLSHHQELQRQIHTEEELAKEGERLLCAEQEGKFQ